MVLVNLFYQYNCLSVSRLEAKFPHVYVRVFLQRRSRSFSSVPSSHQSDTKDLTSDVLVLKIYSFLSN